MANKLGQKRDWRKILFVSLFLSVILSLAYNQKMNKQEYIKSKEQIRELFDGEDFVVDEAGARVYFKEFLHGEKYILVNFWASWCRICVSELEELDKIVDDNIAILHISIDRGNNPVQNVKELYTKHGVRNLKILVDYDKSIFRKLNLYAVPVAFLIDENGNLIDKFEGQFIQEFVTKFREINNQN